MKPRSDIHRLKVGQVSDLPSLDAVGGSKTSPSLDVEGGSETAPYRANVGAFLADARFAIAKSGVREERPYAS